MMFNRAMAVSGRMSGDFLKRAAGKYPAGDKGRIGREKASDLFSH